jgi:hypothetical protein
MLEKKEHPTRRLSIPGMLKVLMYLLIKFKKTGENEYILSNQNAENYSKIGLVFYRTYF